jgi:hypothetical protein
MSDKKERKNRKLGRVYENKLPSGKSILNLSVSKPYKTDSGEIRGGRFLFEDSETGKLYLVKSATIFEVNKEDDKALFDVVVDINNDYQVEEIS